MKSFNLKASKWIEDIISKDINSFYKSNNGFIEFYDKTSENFVKKPGQENFIVLKNLNKDQTIWKNDECKINDIGDGILNIEFNSKMNSINQNILQV